MAISVYKEACFTATQQREGAWMGQRGSRAPSLCTPVSLDCAIWLLKRAAAPQFCAPIVSSVHASAAVGRPRRYADCGCSALLRVVSHTGHLSADDLRRGCRPPPRGTPVRRPPTRAGFGDNQVSAENGCCRSLSAPCNKNTGNIVHGVAHECGVCGCRAPGAPGGVREGWRCHVIPDPTAARPPAQHVLCVCINFIWLAAGCSGRHVFQAPTSASAAVTAGGTCQQPTKWRMGRLNGLHGDTRAAHPIAPPPRPPIVIMFAFFLSGRALVDSVGRQTVV